MIFETHAHYDDEKFDEDRAELLSSMQENGIGRIINVSANLESLENTRKLMEAYPFIYGAFGLHPDEVGDLNEDVMARMLELCRMEKAVAVGEIGLDYYWDKENHEKQEYWFRRQIALAREEKLPMIIHSREAAADTLRVMKEEKSEEIGGVIHCFSYSVEMAEEYLKMGFYLGIGGVVTFKNAKKWFRWLRWSAFCWKQTVRIWHRFRTGENEIHLCICRTLCRRSQNSREFRKKKSLRRQKKMRSDCFEQRNRKRYQRCFFCFICSDQFRLAGQIE